jgi:hypothetical protein
MTVNEKKELVNAVISSHTACSELKQASRDYLDAVGTENEKEAANLLIAELEEDVNSIDDTIAFFSSDFAKSIFGDATGEKLALAKQAKANGDTVCICDGCRTGYEILKNKDEFLK